MIPIRPAVDCERASEGLLVLLLVAGGLLPNVFSFLLLAVRVCIQRLETKMGQ